MLGQSNQQHRRRRLRLGYTLVELMVATGLSGGVAVITVALASRQRSFHEAHRQISEVQQNTAYLIDTVERDLRMAGYGLDVPPEDLANWISWEPLFTSNPRIIQGASGLPDRLMIAAAFDLPLAELASGITTGATHMTVNYTGHGSPPFDSLKNQVLYLGKSETVRIVNVTGVSGNAVSMDISTDPVYNVKGTRFAYPAGTPIELVTVVEYRWNNGQAGTGYAYVSRTDSSSRSVYGGLWEVSSENIADFQITQVGKNYRVEAVGIAAKRDKNFVHGSEGDHYRRRKYQVVVRPRN